MGQLKSKKKDTKVGVKMIDTIKIISMIDRNTYDKISNNSIIKTSYKRSTKEIFYEIVNDHLERFL